MMNRGVSISVVGQGALAQAVTAALGRVQGVVQVCQTSGVPVPGTSLVVEMVGGVEPAFRLAMGALGTGIPCIVTSPLLMAAHGRVLANAALGQHVLLGTSAIGFAFPVEEMMAGARHIRLVTAGGAQAVLARMGYRGESYEQAEKELYTSGADLTDASGKMTQARAMTLLGRWRDAWPRFNDCVRMGVDGFAPEDFRSLRAFGLQPVYGAEITPETIYTGPLAVSPASPLVAAGTDREVMLVQTDEGEILLSAPADETARVVRGVVADVRRWMQRKPVAAVQPYAVTDSFVRPETGLCYVRVPYGRRDMALAAAGEVVHERIEGNGTWQAVVRGADVRDFRLRLPEAVIMPIAGAWEAPSAGLRLVG